MKPVHLLLLVAMNCLWAATLSAFKVLAPWLDGGGIVTWRYALASLACALLWVWFPGAAPRGRDLLRSAGVGLLVFCLGPRMQTAGVQMGQAGDAAVLMAFEPLMTAVAAALVLREHIALRRWLGIACGMAGVLLISEVWTAGFHWHQLAANALVLASFLAETGYSILSKPILERAGPLKVMATGLFAGTVLNLAWDGSRMASQVAMFTVPAWGLLLYLSLVCTVFGYGLWLVVIRETPVNIAVLTVFIQPVAGVVIAMIWLQERPHWGQLWGILAIVAGLVVGFRKNGEKAEQVKSIESGECSSEE
jgi:drug/metabolite transporter (DMT)-like permease